MKSLLAFPIVAFCLAVTGLAGEAEAQQRKRDQDAAFAAKRAGEILSLRDIEGPVLARMRGFHYLGPEFDGASGSYRLKFMKDGNVVWIDVDGRTGRVIGRSGF